jgi:hypothetical protein
MRKARTYITLVIAGIFFISFVSSQDYEKLAQSGFQFLSVVSDEQGAAMGEAMTSLEVGSRAMFFNPAGMSKMDGLLDVTVSNNRWIADIMHNTLGLSFSPAGGNYGVLGFSVQSVDYGTFYGTRVNTSLDAGYENTGEFKLNSIAVGVGYARSLTERFSVGGQVRWVRQDLGESIIPSYVTVSYEDTLTGLTLTRTDTVGRKAMNKLEPLSFDFGTQFHTGYKSLVIGMSVRNFSKEIKYVDEAFQLPLVFNLGISMNLMDFMEEKIRKDHSLYMSIDASHYRSRSEQIKIGLDYCIQDVICLRGGYISASDESGFSIGAGIRYAKASFDYAYTPFGVFSTVQRMTVRFSM